MYEDHKAFQGSSSPQGPSSSAPGARMLSAQAFGRGAPWEEAALDVDS